MNRHALRRLNLERLEPRIVLTGANPITDGTVPTPEIHLDASDATTVAAQTSPPTMTASMSQYLVTPDAPALDETTQLSITFQATQTSLGLDRNFVSKWSYGGSGTIAVDTGSHTNQQSEISVWFAQPNGSLGAIATTSGANIKAGIAYDFAIVFNAGTLQVYINGVLQQLTVTGPSIPATLTPSSAALDVGRWDGFGRYLDGSVQDVGIWNVALSQSQIQNVAGRQYEQLSPQNQAGAQAFWDLSGTGSSFTDSVGGLQLVSPTGLTYINSVQQWTGSGTLPTVFTPSPQGTAPQYVANSPLNSQGAILFDGVTDALKYASAELPKDKSGDVFIVAQFTGGGDDLEGDTLLSLSSDTTAQDYLFFASYNPTANVPVSAGEGRPLFRTRYRETAPNDSGQQTDSRGSALNVVPGVTYVLHFWGAGPGGGYGMTVNSVNDSPFYVTAPSPAIDGSWFGGVGNATNLTIGDFERSDGPQGFAAAYLSEIDVWGGTPSQPILAAADVNTITNYLMAKYGATTPTAGAVPAITAPTAGLGVNTGGALVINGISVVDASMSTTQNVTVTLAASEGKIKLSTVDTGGVIAAQITGNGSNLVSITAPLAAINATLAAADGVTYSPTSGYFGSDVLSISADDPTGNTNTANLSITIAGPLIITAPSATQTGANESWALGGISIADPSLPVGDNVTLTLATTNCLMSVSTAVAGGVSNFQVIGNGSTSVTIVAPLAAINATLAAQSGVRYTPLSGFIGSDTVTVSAVDPLGNAGTSSVSVLVAGPLTISAPSNVQSGLNGTWPVKGISLRDPLLPTSDNVAATLSAAAGVVNLSTTVSGGITSSEVTGNGSGAVSIVAPLAAINATLATAGALTYTPTAAFNGSDVLAISVADPLGNSNATNILISLAGPLAVSISGPSAGGAGQVLTFTLAAIDPSPDEQAAGFAFAIDWGDGSAVQIVNDLSGTQVVHTFNSVGQYTVTVAVADQAGLKSAPVTQNVAISVPLAGVSGPSDTLRGAQQVFTFTANDPSPADQGGNFSFTIDWGDGSAPQTVTGPSGTRISHGFNAAGALTITATATDQDNVASAPVTQAVQVDAVQLRANAQNPALVDLVWGGTGGADSVQISQLGASAGGGVTIRVHETSLNGTVVNNTQDFPGITGRVIATGDAGNDLLDASGLSTTQATLDGGADNNTLYGGQAGDILIGGSNGGEGKQGSNVIIAGNGDNTIYGNDITGAEGATGGNNLIIGGTGRDTIYGNFAKVVNGKGQPSTGGEGGQNLIIGGGGGDTIYASQTADGAEGGHGSILIAGQTTLSQIALQSVLTEWTSTDTLAAKIADISGTGTGPRSNGNNFLIAGSTVTDDGVPDQLYSDTNGQANWLFDSAVQDAANRVKATDNTTDLG